MGETFEAETEERRLVRTLVEIRKTRGITQQQLADHLGISAQQLSKVERGENRLSLGRFVVALKFLKGSGDGADRATWAFAEAEQAIYDFPGDPRGELLEAVQSARGNIERLEEVARRILVRP